MSEMGQVQLSGTLQVRANFRTQGAYTLTLSDMVQRKQSHGNEGLGKYTMTAAGAASGVLC